jgi:hypothetical protein
LEARKKTGVLAGESGRIPTIKEKGQPLSQDGWPFGSQNRFGNAQD